MDDPTKAAAPVIQLAYDTVYTIPSAIPSQESFRRGIQKKNENPVHTAPTLNRVITHLERKKDFAWAKRKACKLVLSREAEDYIGALRSTDELKEFLAALSLFLRTTKTKEREGMKTYKPRSDTPLPPAQIIARAWQITQALPWRAEFTKNKLTRMAGRIRGAQSKWECLAVLAQYYPLRGVSQLLIDRLVDELGMLDLASFQAVMSQVLVFYDAASVTLPKNKVA